MPGNKVLSQNLDTAPVSPSVGSQSSVEPYREQVKTWVDQGIQSTTIHQALVRHYQFTGSYSTVHRFVRSQCEVVTPKSTVKLDFAPGEAAQVDFGTGPGFVDARTGKQIKSGFFLMTLAYSRHQYAEIVLNQKSATWLEKYRAQGVIKSVYLSKASTHDIHYLEDVKEQFSNCVLIGDKGYLSQQYQVDLFAQNQIKLETPMGRNQTSFKPFNPVLRKARKRIETLFSQLCDQFMIRRNYAKSFQGLATRVLSKVTALTVVQWINQIDGRPLNNIKIAIN